MTMMLVWCVNVSSVVSLHGFLPVKLLINGMLGILIGFLVLEMLISVVVIMHGLCTMGTDGPEV
jgi:hypothetical protein